MMLVVFLFFLASGTGGKFKSSASLVFERLAGSKRFVAPVDMLQLHTGHVHVSPERVKDEFFSRVDLSGDGTLSKEEFLSLFSLVEESEDDPVEIHLSIAGKSSLTVMWVTDKLVEGSSLSWRQKGASSQWNVVPANVSTYDAGLLGWHKKIYTAEMSPLVPDTAFEYKVGSDKHSSDVFSTIMPNWKRSSSRLILFGDHGTIQPLGFEVAAQVKRLCLSPNAFPCDAAHVIGDLAYAWKSLTLGPELEWLWDVYQNEQQQYAAHIPMQTTVGNHELFEDAIAYRHRFQMAGPASGGNGSIYYSYDVGPVHVVSFSTESDYQAGTPQYEWMERDLAAARPHASWIVLTTHRPIFSSDSFEHEQHIPGSVIPTHLEPLFVKYKVDLVVTGHCHFYERIYPSVNGTVMIPTPSAVYVNPNATCYVVQGTGGAYGSDEPTSPQPSWSAVRVSHLYGVGVLDANTTHLVYRFLLEKDDTVFDQFTIVKAS